MRADAPSALLDFCATCITAAVLYRTAVGPGHPTRHLALFFFSGAVLILLRIMGIPWKVYKLQGEVTSVSCGRKTASSSERTEYSSVTSKPLFKKPRNMGRIGVMPMPPAINSNFCVVAACLHMHCHRALHTYLIYTRTKESGVLCAGIELHLILIKKEGKHQPSVGIKSEVKTPSKPLKAMVRS
jgi:hypothetical protein